MFDVRPKERRLIGAFILLSFLQGLSSVVGTALGRSLFLTHYSTEYLPAAYAAVSLILPFLGATFLLASRRLPPSVLLSGTAALSSAVYGAVWLALQGGHDGIAAAVAMVWVDVDWSLVLLVFLGLASHRLDVRQQRRLLGVAAAGDIAAGISAGYLLPVLLPFVGLDNLPLVASLAQAAAAIVVFALLVGRSALAEARPTPLNQLVGDRFLRSAWSLLAIGWFAFYVIDALFLSVAAQHYPGEAELAGFLGLFLGTTAIADAVASIGLYGLLLGRFGVLGGLLGGPIATGVFAALLALFGGAPASLLVLGLASALKLADITARENVTEPAISTLYAALPPGDRVAAQAMGSTIVGPIVGLLAAPALWFVLGPLGLGVRGLAGLALTLLLLTTLFARNLGRAWPRALQRALVRDAPIQADVTLTGAEGKEAIVDGLMSPDPQVVVTAVRLLRRVATRDLLENLGALLSHRTTEVREGTARLLEEIPLQGSEGKLAARMVDEPDMNVRALLYRALMATSHKTGIDLLQARVRGDDLGERGAALDALIRHGDERASSLIDEGLGSLAAGTPQERRVAEHLEGRRKPLTDGDLLAMLTLKSPWDLRVILGRRRVSPDQVARVAEVGWKPLRASKKLRLATALGVLSEKQGRPILLRMLSDGAGAAAALVALQKGRKPSEQEYRSIRRSIERDLGAVPALRRRAEVRPDALSRAALREDAELALRRTLLALALLHPGKGLATIWEPLHENESRPLALEILETVLPREDWVRLEPLLPGSTSTLPVGVHSEETLSGWTRMCLGSPAEAYNTSVEFEPLRHVGFLRGAPDRLLVELYADQDVRLWVAKGAHVHDLPARARATLLIDHPARRAPLLLALSGAGGEGTPVPPGGTHAEFNDREKLVALGACPAFANASRAVKRMLVAAATVRSLAPREFLFRAGEHGNSAALVISGEFEGRGAGSLLSLRVAMTPGPQAHSWKATSRAQVLLLPRRALLHAATESGAVAQGLAEILGRP